MRECAACGAVFEDALTRCPADGGPSDPGLPGSPVLDGRYRLERRLGAGGMGRVYAARHLALGIPVAVKVLHDARMGDARWRERFREEARLLARLDHPAIVRVTDFGIDPRSEGIPYLVMELHDGGSLGEWMERHGPLPPREALWVLGRAAEALDHAHREGVVHGDLKPANILVSRPDGGLAVKLADFGISRRLGEPAVPSPRPIPPSRPRSDRTETLDDADGRNALRGTPRYMAPEAWRGAAGPPADRYSLGLVAAEMLAGEVLLAELDGIAPPLAVLARRLPQPAARLLARILDPDPGRRPAAASPWAQALGRAWARWDDRGPRRRRLTLALASVLVVSAMLSAGACWLQRSPSARLVDYRIQDSLFAFHAPRPADQRLCLVAIPERVIEKDTAEAVAPVFERALEGGASGLALDFLLPGEWSSSPAFIRLVTRYPDRVALAMLYGQGGRMIGRECLEGLSTAALGEDRAASLFGLVNLDEDPDGIVRRFRPWYGGPGAARVPDFALRTASLADPGLRTRDLPAALRLNSNVDFGAARISWKEFLAALESDPGRFAGRVVLAGGEYEDLEDLHRLPARPGRPSKVTGLEVQGMRVDALLRNDYLIQPDDECLRWTLGGVLALAGGAGLFLQKRRAILLLHLVLVAFYLMVALLSVHFAHLLLPLAAPLAAGAVLTLAALARPFVLGRGGEAV